MFEQINNQSVALGKSYTDTFVKAQGIAMSGLERITELNLRTFEDRVKASVEFWTSASDIRDMEAAKALTTKGVQLAKESAEKLYANSQEVVGVTMKTSEAIGSLAKGSFETTNATMHKQAAAAKKAGAR